MYHDQLAFYDKLPNTFFGASKKIVYISYLRDSKTVASYTLNLKPEPLDLKVYSYAYQYVYLCGERSDEAICRIFISSAEEFKSKTIEMLNTYIKQQKEELLKTRERLLELSRFIA